jgi:mono/diheme cytochrome c family protein
MKTSQPHSTRLLAVLLVVLLVGAMAVAAQQAELIARGKVTYRIYCQNCHGDTAKGDGRVAQWLTVKPTDLTLITKANEGTFPFDRVYRIIDGREEVAGHGLRDMPIWGQLFLETSGNEDHVRGKILQLIEYLKSIQETDGQAAASH